MVSGSNFACLGVCAYVCVYICVVIVRKKVDVVHTASSFLYSFKDFNSLPRSICVLGGRGRACKLFCSWNLLRLWSPFRFVYEPVFAAVLLILCSFEFASYHGLLS